MTGPFYTLVLESTRPNLAAMETMMPRVMGDKDWQANYQKMLPLVESGERFHEQPQQTSGGYVLSVPMLFTGTSQAMEIRQFDKW
jgi:hypothetical protein